MLRRPPNRYLASWILILAAAFLPAGAQPKRDKTTANFDGGIFMATDGALPSGACFRVNGRAYAPEFFDNLKREDSVSGSLYRRGNDIITEFPKQLHLALLISDTPCDPRRWQVGSRVYLSDDMIRKLHLNFYWKRGLEMRPASGITVVSFEIRSLPHYFQSAGDPPPLRYEWLLDFDVPSDGVPLTDSLVLILRTPDHHVVARTAARL